METRDDLTQLYPYPEKLEESSEDATSNKDTPRVQQRETPPRLQEGPATDTEDFQAPTVPGNRKVRHAADKRPNTAAQEKGPSNNYKKRLAIDRQPSVAPRAGGTVDIMRESIDCFDVNLDTLPASQAAALAEQMLAMMSVITLGEPLILAPPPQEQQQISTSTPLDTEPDLSRVKQEDKDDDDRETLSPPSLSDAEDVKEEPETVASSQSFAPTQERRSMETNPILCATVMTLTKKHQLENTAKVLMARVTDDLVTRPTHVVMDLSQEQSESGGGRTVKYFLGILRGCWVLRYEWITASMNAGYWVHESPYQIYDNEFGINAPKISRASHLRRDPPLFAGCEVQLFGTFTRPTKDELELMIEAGGGMVVSQLFSWSMRSTVLRSDGTDNAHPTRHIILYNQANDGVRNLRRLKTEIRSVSEVARTLDRRVQVVHHREFLDCIASYDISTMGESDLYADLA
ncbi:BRCA1-associated RING domain protein 1 [Mortierella sp. NVP85]|nr:BRCA1-associated RING domain protein 1 [Mortierella sp. NVP85]